MRGLQLAESRQRARYKPIYEHLCWAWPLAARESREVDVGVMASWLALLRNVAWCVVSVTAAGGCNFLSGLSGLAWASP
eukprot:3378189-Alexandrium_andersonii.AAC.1